VRWQTTYRIGPERSSRSLVRTRQRVGRSPLDWFTVADASFTDTLHVESDALLAQHTRYALIVTNRLRDPAGRPVEASEAFHRFCQTVRGEYKHALLEAIHAARRLGVRERDIVTASVFTTQSDGDSGEDPRPDQSGDARAG